VKGKSQARGNQRGRRRQERGGGRQATAGADGGPGRGIAGDKSAARRWASATKSICGPKASRLQGRLRTCLDLNVVVPPDLRPRTAVTHTSAAPNLRRRPPNHSRTVVVGEREKNRKILFRVG